MILFCSGNKSYIISKVAGLWEVFYNLIICHYVYDLAYPPTSGILHVVDRYTAAKLRVEISNGKPKKSRKVEEPKYRLSFYENFAKSLSKN